MNEKALREAWRKTGQGAIHSLFFQWLLKARSGSARIIWEVIKTHVPGPHDGDESFSN